MRSSKRLVVAGVLVALAGICYSSWVLEFLWPSPLDPLRSFLSELDAAHRPHRHVYEIGDILTASCAVLAAAVLLLPRPSAVGRYGVIALVSFAIFGASTFADVALPIECIPHVDPDCPSEPNGLLPQLHHVHALTSTIAVFAIFITMIAAVAAAWRSTTAESRPIWPLLRVVGLAVLIIIVIATIWMLAADGLDGDFRLGLAQRIQIGGMTVWLVLWGWAIATQRVSPTATSTTRSSEPVE